jgi:hypothetical protein
MHAHVVHIGAKGKDETKLFRRVIARPIAGSISARPLIADFLEHAGLLRVNPLLYRCFPLTCARSQE